MHQNMGMAVLMRYKAMRQFKINDIIEQAESARASRPEALRLRGTSSPTQNEEQDPWGYVKPSHAKVPPRPCRNRRPPHSSYSPTPKSSPASSPVSTGVLLGLFRLEGEGRSLEEEGAGGNPGTRPSP
jgi:hypothetical protein